MELAFVTFLCLREQQINSVMYGDLKVLVFSLYYFFFALESFSLLPYMKAIVNQY